MIGIIGAMDEEVAMLKEKLTEVQVETKAAMDFYKGKLEGKDVVVVRSGAVHPSIAGLRKVIFFFHIPT